MERGRGVRRFRSVLVHGRTEEGDGRINAWESRRLQDSSAEEEVAEHQTEPFQPHRAASFRCSEELLELAKGPVMPRQHGAEGFVERLGDLPEAEASGVPEMDDAPIGRREPFDGGAERGDLLPRRQRITATGASGFRPGSRPSRVAAPGACQRHQHGVVGRTRLPVPTTLLVAKPVQRDPEEPRLEAALLDVLADLRRHRTEGALSDLLGQIRIVALRPNHAVQAGRESRDDHPPCVLITPSGGTEQPLQLPRCGRVIGRW